MEVFKNKTDIHSYISRLKSANHKIGIVPTMGALHEGHLSLVKTAKSENDFVVATIFVNPTQFDNPNDLNKYPRTLEDDLKLLELNACDAVFVPTITEMYGDEPTALHFDFEGLDQEMEGKFRTGHFSGVATIVKKLFEILVPNNAYFGEKDFQQLQIIKSLCSQLKLPINIIGCPIYREKDGLAMSSRNTRLSAIQRKEAPLIYQCLKETKTKGNNTSLLNQWAKDYFKNTESLELEYLIIAEEDTLKPVSHIQNSQKPRAFIAVYAGDVRLIDNIALY